MITEEIQERNKQIAFMLGWEEEVGSWYTNKGFARIVIYSAYNNYPHVGLPFYRDWNWLMEAVEFIEKLKFNTKACIHCNNDRVYLNTYPIESSQYSAKFISITNSKINFCSTKASTKKEAVFIAVSDFAKLYNQNKL